MFSRSTGWILGMPVVLGGALLIFDRSPVQEEELDWPREIVVDEGTIVVYQPQVDTLDGDRLTGRSAVSVEAAESPGPIFGTVWFDARIETDFDSRVVRIKTVRVPNVRFPNASEQQQNDLARLLEREALAWDLDVSLDRLLTGLDLAAQRRGVTSDLNNDPPAIIFTTVPSILVTIDGDPSLQTIPNTNYRRVINSPFDIIFDPATETYYLFAGPDQWYSSPRWQDSWTLASSVPNDLAQLAPDEPEEEEPAEDTEPEEPAEPGPPPEIVVATEPTELVVSDGEIQFTPMEAVNNLLYVSNSESDIVFDIESQTYYVVLSGRWFQSKSLTDGPWTFVEGADLPQSFNFIRPESEMGHLLVSVSGTEQAENAVLENQIPQTSAIDRSTTTLEVTYDGDPIFEPIPNTSTAYATNTEVAVIRVGGVYYACDDAVWFVAGNPHGPWSVADQVPDDIYEIPPSAPVYNVTYVHVYHSTPSVVYVGYYPGYVGSYVYGGTIVYGTGYWYNPWCCAVYYPRPYTWGFHMRWNPWFGWGFGFSYIHGPFTFGVGWGSPWHHRGFWGPAGYRGYRRGYHRGWHYGARAGARAGYRAGYRAGQRRNIYNRPQNRPRNVPRASTRPQNRPRATPQTRPNNVYSDRSGNVYRRNDNGNWQQRGGSGWQPSTGGANRSQLDRSAQTRQRGATRSNNYRRSGGGARGGRRR